MTPDPVLCCAFCSNTCAVVLASFALQNMGPARATCSAGIRGVYDPPYTHIAVSASAAPTASALLLDPPTNAPAPVPVALIPNDSPTQIVGP